MFEHVKKLMQQQFAGLVANGPLFQVELDRDLVWQKYLNAFPEATRQEHNCNCCKSFLRQYGGIVGIKNNQIITLWDFECDDAEYKASIAELRRYIATCPIVGPFFNAFEKCGTDKNVDGKKPGIVWTHWFVKLPKEFVAREDVIPSTVGAMRTNQQTLLRAVQEIDPVAVDTVLELIGQNSLYRGQEFKPLVENFRKIQKQVRQIPEEQRALHCWVKSREVGPAACSLRNSAIGSLLVDLSEGRELDPAVKSFETKVAGPNYKRPTALVTPRMLEAAKKRLEEMGMVGSLQRRLLHSRDLTADAALHVHRSIKAKGGDVFEQLKEEVITNPKSLSKVEEISISKFLSDVLPTAQSVRVLLENRHATNFVSLVGPVDPTTPTMFKWGNNYSWSYAGEVADSIKERVKAAGGLVDAKLRVSLSWHNGDDLDLHCIQPNGVEICFRSKRGDSGGTLDVDMNAGGAHSRTPVENIAWPVDPWQEGIYKFYVHQFNKRESADTGFTVQLEWDGELHEVYVARNGETDKRHDVFEIKYSRKKGVEVISGSTGKPTAYSSQEKWGLKTGMWHQVQAITLSPNHWGSNVGNKHFFFLLAGCKTDERVRPFFNEFLTPELDKDRKVFELLGSKVEVETVPDELSGLGFSETVRNHLFVEVKGAFTRQLKIAF